MIAISEAIAIAFQSYQAGNLSQAESICHQILQQQPNTVEALHLLATIAHQLGNLKEAIAYYQQTLALIPDNAQVYYSLGSALHASGQLAEAIAYYQQATILNPNYTDAHYNLAYAFQQQGQLSAAIRHYQQVISLNPNDAEAYGNLAHVLEQQGQITAAIAYYQQAIALKPDVPEIYYILGNLYKQQDQLEAAINHYQWTLALNPNYTDAYLKLGTCLHASGQLDEAIFCYQQAISLQPNLPDAYYKLGNAFLERGRNEEAIVQYRQALALEPNFPDPYVGLGHALHQTQLEEAIAYLQQALTLNPNHAEAYHYLGMACAGQNKMDEAIGYFQKALQLKADFVAADWQNKLLLPILYDTPEQIPLWRQRFCRGLNNVIQQIALDTPESKKQALKGLARIATAFYLGYQGLCDRGLQRKYGTLLHSLLAANYPQWATSLPMPPLSNTDKIRVGYLSAHFREHTAAKLTLGWLKNADKQHFEIYTYHIGCKADFTTQQFRDCSDRFYHLYGNLQAICQQILADRLHILVFTDIGMEPRSTYLAGLRLASVQCVTWGHPITSGFPTLDYFLSSDLMEPDNGQSHYCEKVVRLPNIGVCYEKPSIPEQRKTRSDLDLCEDAVIYLSCQSLFKYLPQFDSIFPQIAQRVPHAQFVFLSHPAPTVTEQFKARLSHAFANLNLNSEDYCVVLPRLDRVDYLNLNLVSDIFLDTFSWSGGNTTLEAIACGLPIVTCPGEFMRGRHSYGILKMMGVTETIAKDEAEYIEIAVRLGLDANWRQEIVQKTYERHSELYDDRTCVTALESFYKQLVLPLAPNP